MVYMSVCQALTGSGGWPLTILMTPDQKPFWAGTYLPKSSAYGRMGILDLLSVAKKIWQSDRQKILSSGDEIAALLDKARVSAKADPQKQVLHKAFKEFEHAYDEQWGGFGWAPKFPSPHNLLFLMRYSQTENNSHALAMVEHTLRQMFRGGIFDHVGGGFSRYSTDEKWLVPHFEKMLYDNALLSFAYLEAYHITRKDFYLQVAKRTLDYVLRELTNKDGGFYCGQDADSNGVEGEYYTFTIEEIYHVLGQGDGTAFIEWFGLTNRGNFEGKNVLNLLKNSSYEENNSDIASSAAKLYNYRLSRVHLHKDDKVLTSWNALMISALAKAGYLTGDALYLQAAKKAADFLNVNLSNKDGGLMVRWREGEAAYDAQLDDYAFYAFALLELYHATLDIKYLKQAAEISSQMIDRFWDEEAGGFFFYSKYAEQLIARPKETFEIGRAHV